MRGGIRIATVAAMLVTAVLTTNSVHFVPATAAEASQVSEHELRQLFPGEFSVVVHGFLKVHVTANGDGSLFAQQIGKSDTGRWEIRAGRLCIRFSKWLKSRTRCSPVIEKAGWYRTSDITFKKI